MNLLDPFIDLQRLEKEEQFLIADINLRKDQLAIIQNFIASLHRVEAISADKRAEKEDDEALIIKLSNFYKDKEIHHKDGDPRNYDIENLEVVTRKDLPGIDESTLEEIVKRGTPRKNMNMLNGEETTARIQAFLDFGYIKGDNGRWQKP